MHDENKIEELIKQSPVIIDINGDNAGIHENDVRFIAKQYAEHMVQQEREAYYKQ